MNYYQRDQEIVPLLSPSNAFYKEQAKSLYQDMEQETKQVVIEALGGVKAQLTDINEQLDKIKQESDAFWNEIDRLNSELEKYDKS